MRVAWDELNKIPILRVAERLKLPVKGSKMLCFNGHDTEPSLSFNIKENYWNCFGCELGGNVVQLVMHALQCDKYKAIEWLENQFFQGKKHSSTSSSVAPPLERYKPLSRDTNYQPDPEIYNWIAETFPLKDTGLKYLTERGFERAEINRFKISEILNPHSALQTSIKKWGLNRLELAGLIARSPERISLIWFKPALLFPVFQEGKIIYIQARLRGASKIRWLGLKGIQKPIFNGDILRSLKKGESVFICEGPTDTIAASQLGLNAVGILGAMSFRKEWVDLFKAFRVFVVPDRDPAGKKFAIVIQKYFKEKGLAVTTIAVEHGKDLADNLSVYKNGH